jgi:predicted RNA binding protein YcfA (HicA-like mRNA interferase family)
MLTHELIVALEAAGFREIRVGLDSADDVVVARHCRKAIPETVVRTLYEVRSLS